MLDAAAGTGGSTFNSGRSFNRGSLAGPFRQILEDYRQRYVLQYEPSGVARDGWHDIKVELTRFGRYDIRARRGYYVSAASGRP